MFSGVAGRGRHIAIDINSYPAIDSASELLSETLVEACKEAGWKVRGSKLNANHKTNGLIRNTKQKRKLAIPWGKNFS